MEIREEDKTFMMREERGGKYCMNWFMLCSRFGCYACPLGVCRSEDMGVLPVEDVHCVHAMSFEQALNQYV